MAKQIPRRTSDIELWDANPIGNRAAWRREAVQFWSLMLSRGKVVRSPAYLFVDNEYVEQAGAKAKIPTKRPFTVSELAEVVVSRLAESGVVEGLGDRERHALEQWLVDSIVVPGERIRWLPEPPAAGLSLRHYGEVATLNRTATRQRYWAAFLYSTLKTDLDFGRTSGSVDTAGGLLDEFLADGLIRSAEAAPEDLRWAVDKVRLATRDPEIFLPLVALSGASTAGFPSISEGMPEGWMTGARDSDLQDEFLCPGIVILLRRALRLILNMAPSISHTVLGDLIETVLVNHAALYFVRGLRVLNELTERRRLADDCGRCWARFQHDLRPKGSEGRDERWSRGEYAASATADDARFVETNCADPNQVFINAARKEQQDAKDLARQSLEGLRQQLADYTVNRIALRVCWDVAREASGPALPGPQSLSTVLATLDEWYSRQETRMMMAALWRNKILKLATDKDVPGTAAQLAASAEHEADPRALEVIARGVIAETILASRTFPRYVEVMHSLLGGAALPSNQDPKGFVARGGTASSRFHLTIHDRALEALVAIASLEHRDEPLSFQRFIEFARRRYGLLFEGGPSRLDAPSGLVADASEQSREGLRSRLSAMGMLAEFSDSSDWNRVHWGHAHE